MLSRSKLLIVLGATLICIYYLFTTSPRFYPLHPYTKPPAELPALEHSNAKFQWANVPQHFPVQNLKSLPTNIPKSVPRIQHKFPKETAAERTVRLSRLELVRGNFTHAWNGYKDHAWLQDEVMPLSGGSQNPFGGWAATMVDALGQLPLQFA